MRRVRRVLVLAVLLVLLLVAAAPWLANLGFVRRYVASVLERRLGRPVTLGGLVAGWTSGVEVRLLAVANAGEEFGDGHLLEARSVRISMPLHRILLGTGDTDVLVDGLNLRLEEHAGGRTNLDDLLTRFRPKAAPGKPAVPREPTALRLALTNASVSLRRLPRRPQPAPVDPFRGDPVVLAADEGALDLGAERFDLEVVADRAGTRIRFGGGVRVSESTAQVSGGLRLSGGDVEGEVAAKGIDLALLEPFLGEPIAGRIDVNAAGAPGGFTVRAFVRDLSLRGVAEEHVELVARVQGGRIEEARLRAASGAALDASGALDGVTGTASVSNVVLGDLPPQDVRAEFDVSIRGREVEIRSLRAATPDATLEASGTAAMDRCELRCSATADLKLLAPLLERHEEVSGRASVSGLVRVEPSGDAYLKGSGDVADLAIGDELRLERPSFEIEAALEEGRNVLRVLHGRAGNLTFDGRAVGLRDPELREIHGSLRGTLALSRLLPLLAGIRDLEDLRGELTIDAKASTGPDGLAVAGGLVVEDLRAAGFGRRIARDRLELSGRLSRPPGGPWSGSCAAFIHPVRVDIDELVVDGGRYEAVGGVETFDLSGLPGLPEELAVSGMVGGTFHVTSSGVEASFGSDALTALWQGHGIERADLRLDVRARRSGDRWRLLGTKANVGGFGVELVEGGVRAEGPLEALAGAATDLGPYAPRGRLAATARLDGDAFAVDGQVTGFAADIGGKRVSSERLRIEAAGRRGEVLELNSVTLELDQGTIRGSGEVGERTDLRFRIDGDLRALAPYLPGVTGSGPVSVEARVSAPRPGAEGRLLVDGKFAADRAAAPPLTARAAKGTFSFDGLLRGRNVQPVAVHLDAEAAEVTYGTVRMNGCSLGAKGAGKPLVFQAVVSAREMSADEFPFQQVRADLNGKVASWDIESLRSLDLAGQLRFARMVGHKTVWEKGTANAELRDGALHLSNIAARVNGGTIEGRGRLDVAGDGRAWEVHVTSKDVRLTEAMDRPLSHLIPILRLGGGKESSLSGVLDARLDLKGAGMTAADVKRSLSGTGTVRFRNFDLRGSILLGRIAKAARRLLGQEAYTFRDLDIAFAVSGGRVHAEPFELKGRLLSLEFDGDVGLDGTVDSLIRVNLLPIPLRITGHLDDPKVRPAPLAGFR